MQDEVIVTPTSQKRVPWNKGKLTGAKPPLRPKHVWAIRTKLQIEGRVRDLAMFNLAIDSKLRGCDVVAIRVEDVAASGYTADRATVRQRKTSRPVRFELSEQTRQALCYLKASTKDPASSLHLSFVVHNIWTTPSMLYLFRSGRSVDWPRGCWDPSLRRPSSRSPTTGNLGPFSFSLGHQVEAQ